MLQFVLTGSSPGVVSSPHDWWYPPPHDWSWSRSGSPCPSHCNAPVEGYMCTRTCISTGIGGCDSVLMNLTLPRECSFFLDKGSVIVRSWVRGFELSCRGSRNIRPHVGTVADRHSSTWQGSGRHEA